MKLRQPTHCSNCKRLAQRLAKLEEQLADALARIAKREEENARFLRALANRFRQYGQSYFRFITTPGIEPTNNLAEQAIRFVVIDRRITQGTRGETGRLWCERIWTVSTDPGAKTEGRPEPGDPRCTVVLANSDGG